MAAQVRSVVWSEDASEALDDAIAYLWPTSQRASQDLLKRALQAAESLSTLSDRGRVVPELSDSTIREIFVQRYRLLYRVEEHQVIVIAFLHGARDFAAWRQTQDTV